MNQIRPVSENGAGQDMEKYIERQKRIREFLNRDNERELREDLFTLCAKAVEANPDMAVDLMAEIVRIAATRLKDEKKTAKQNWLAAERAVHELYAPKERTPRQKAVGSAVVAQALFPDGTCEKESKLTRKFFGDWLANLRKCPELATSKWAVREGLDLYLQKVLDRNAESVAEQPQ